MSATEAIYIHQITDLADDEINPTIKSRLSLNSVHKVMPIEAWQTLKTQVSIVLAFSVEAVLSQF